LSSVTQAETLNCSQFFIVDCLHVTYIQYVLVRFLRQ